KLSVTVAGSDCVTVTVCDDNTPPGVTTLTLSGVTDAGSTGELNANDTVLTGVVSTPEGVCEAIWSAGTLLERVSVPAWPKLAPMPPATSITPAKLFV